MVDEMTNLVADLAAANEAREAAEARANRLAAAATAQELPLLPVPFQPCTSQTIIALKQIS
jgi:hypothetical protein